MKNEYNYEYIVHQMLGAGGLLGGDDFKTLYEGYTYSAGDLALIDLHDQFCQKIKDGNDYVIAYEAVYDHQTVSMALMMHVANVEPMIATLGDIATMLINKVRKEKSNG